MRMRRFTICLALLLAACGSGDKEEAQLPSRYPALPAADALNLPEAELGVGVRSGGPIAAAFFKSSIYTEVVATTPHAMLHVQAYDEAAPTFGEYTSYAAPPDAMAAPATQFLGENTANARFERRVPDLFDELDAADAEAGSGGFASRSVVLNMWRLRKDWWVRWDGNLQDEANLKGKGPYGLNRTAMYDDILDQIESVAQAQKPRYFIVGDEMDLLLASDNGEGFSHADFANFMQFYRAAVDRIIAQSPETKVGAGINWDRFVANVAPLYATGNETENFEVLDRAFEAVILPIADYGDIVALKSYRGPDDESITFPVADLSVTESYQFLRRLPDLYETDAPIVFYSIGSPVSTTVGYLAQKNSLESFSQWTAGLTPELVAWRFMLNFDGTDTSDQVVSARCEAFTTSERAFEMPKSACYDGLVTSVFSKKDSFKYLAGE
jgi:hypothetical protein